MPLMPDDIVRKTFSSVRLRAGYAAAEVDEFLEEIVAEFHRLHNLIDELRAAQVRVPEGPRSESRLSSETSQLEQVRAERADLVSQMSSLQARFEVLQRLVSDQEGLVAEESGMRRLDRGASAAADRLEASSGDIPD